VKLTKLTDSDDIESYLTTFERMMTAYNVPNSRWAFKLAPQLSGKAQKAYAAMESEQATDYAQVKEAILRRYDINCDHLHLFSINQSHNDLQKGLANFQDLHLTTLCSPGHERQLDR